MATRYVRKKNKRRVDPGLWFLLIALVLLAVSLILGLSSCRKETAPAESDALWDGSWYEDGLGRVPKDRALVKGMKAFEKKTGVRPYLSILSGVDPEELDLFAREQYEALFDEGGHVLVVYDEWGEDAYYLAARAGAGSALNASDTSRLLSCIETAYADPGNDTYADAFGAGFARAAKELSVGRRSGGVGLLLTLGATFIALSFVLILFLRKKALLLLIIRLTPF